MKDNKYFSKKEIILEKHNIGKNINPEFIAEMLEYLAYNFYEYRIKAEFVSILSSKHNKFLMKAHKYNEQIKKVCQILSEQELKDIKNILQLKTLQQDTKLNQNIKKNNLTKSIDLLQEKKSQQRVIKLITKEEDLRKKQTKTCEL